MDMGKVFKGCSIAMIVLGGIQIIRVIALMLLGGSVGEAVGGEDGSNAMTYLVFVACLPALILSVVSIFCGRAGIQSDPDRCRKLSRVLAIIAVLDVVSAVRHHQMNFWLVLEVLFYGFYCYLAYTESY